MNATRKTSNYWQYGRSIITGTLAAVAMVALGVSPAQAEEDGKIYPGSMCVLFGGTNPVLNASRLFNHGATDMLLDCPVVHDFITGGRINDGLVDVIDNHSTRGICVSLFRISQVNSSTTTGESTGQVCSQNNDNNDFRSERLTFPGLSGDPDAHYFYSVRIPPLDNGLASAIISYRVDEVD